MIRQLRDYFYLLRVFIGYILDKCNIIKLKSKYSDRGINISKAIAFELQNIRLFLNLLPENNIESIEYKTLLEIGSGQDFGIALALADLRFSKVIVLDPFLVSWDERYHPEFYKTLLVELEKIYPSVDFKSVKEVIRNNRHIAKKLTCYKKGLENIPEIGDETIDISFSNAVFEHFVYPDKAVKELARITKKGGLGFHQIDLRDHRNFDKPLEFLTFPKWMFQYMSKLNHAHFGNRLRYSEYNQIFEKYGFDVGFKADNYADEQYLDEILKSSIKKYREMPREEVGTLGGRFFITKRNN